MQSDFALSSVYEQSSALCAPLSLRIVPTCVVSLVCVCVCVLFMRMCVCACMYACVCACVCVTILPVPVTLSLNYLFSHSFKVAFCSYVPGESSV